VIDPAPRCRVSSSARQNDLVCAQAPAVRQRTIATQSGGYVRPWASACRRM
jgi:hypothetical protein